MKFIKKNQIIIYATALMLVVAGYMNFTTGESKKIQTATADVTNIEDVAVNNVTNIVEDTASTNITSIKNIASTDENIGDAQFVSANVVNEDDLNKPENNSIDVATKTNNIDSSNEYFSKSKLDRETMYSEMLDTYEKILSNNNSTETQKQSATDEIKKINNLKNSIMICENLIETKGFENSVIFANDESISVVVKKDDLSQQDVAQIQNIISREMKTKIENIHISNK